MKYVPHLEVSPPQEHWLPPAYSPELANLYQSPYYGSMNHEHSSYGSSIEHSLLLQPFCYKWSNTKDEYKNTQVRCPQEAVYWHPWSDVAYCQHCADPITVQWFFLHWTVFRYERVAHSLSVGHLFPIERTPIRR